MTVTPSSMPRFVSLAFTLSHMSLSQVLSDKTPMNADSASYVCRATELWERPYFIFLVRHPLAVIDSMIDLHRSQELMRTGVYTTSRAEAWCYSEAAWVSTNNVMLQTSTDTYTSANQRLHITYEDFVRSPEHTTREICKLLGLQWEGSMITPYEGPSVKTFQSHDGEIAATGMCKSESPTPSRGRTSLTSTLLLPVIRSQIAAS